MCIYYDNNVRLFANPNHHAKKDWEASMNLCKVFNIPYKHQSIQKIAQTVFEGFNAKGKRKYLRKYLTSTQRQNLIASQNSKCKTCDQFCEEMEIDHILALSSGGDNSVSNLQALCKKCHEEKSAKESAERLFSIDNIISSFNSETSKIFSRKRNGIIHFFGTDKSLHRAGLH